MRVQASKLAFVIALRGFIENQLSSDRSKSYLHSIAALLDIILQTKGIKALVVIADEADSIF